ncbi:MAG: complement resistance protein TraT [Planctomycetota bacterium]
MDLIWASQVQMLEVESPGTPSVWVSITDTTGDAFGAVDGIAPTVRAAFEDRGYRLADDPTTADFVVRASLRAMVEDILTEQTSKNKALLLGAGLGVGVVSDRIIREADDSAGFLGFLGGITTGLLAIFSLDYYLEEREYALLVDVNIGRRLPQPLEVDQRFAIVNRALDLNASAGNRLTDTTGFNLATTMVGDVESDRTPSGGSPLQSVTLHHTQNPNTVAVFARGRQLERRVAWTMIVPKLENALIGVLPGVWAGDEQVRTPGESR